MARLSHKRGDRKVWRFHATRTDPETKVVTNVDLTGATVWFTVKAAATDADGSAIFQLTVGSGITIDSPATDGKGKLVVDSDKTESLANVRVVGVYDLQIIETAASLTDPETFDDGEYVIEPDVTAAQS